MTYPNQLFSAFSFVGFVLCATPLYWHLKAWNVGTCLYMAWAGLGCLNDFINSVIWNSTVSDVAPVWCDISTRFQTGLVTGLPAAMIVINHRLFKIVSKTTASSSTNARAEKYRALFIDLTIGLGIPLLQMALQIIVEGHRFDIFEEIGCIPHTKNVIPTLPLVLIWAPIMSIVNALYSCLIIRLFWKNSRQLKGMLGSNKNHNQNRYIRLIALSSTQVFFALPISLYVTCFTGLVSGFRPWISWADTHSNYSHIDQYPSLIWRSRPDVQVALELSRWLIVVSAFLFFAFFGFAEEALKHYRLAYTSASSLLRPRGLGISRASRNSAYSLTSFVPRSRKPSAAFVGSPLTSHSRPGTMKECDESTLVSDQRLPPGSSVFEGVHDEPKVVGFLPDEDDPPISPATQTDVVELPTISRVPVPPLPTADSDGAVPSIPPDRINFSHPRRLTSICAKMYGHSDLSAV
ncbi:pheromone A receptor-domain-containing protein [Lactifluus subvellereus]|nr:pheromone A receptor-domain-containing protein [Lactifluus subvellereus]